MKKLILLLLFVPLVSFGQIYVFEDTDLEWNVTEMSVNGYVGQTQIDGKAANATVTAMALALG